MEYVKLGSSDLNVSRICLGCMGFGDARNGQHSWTVDENTTYEIVKKAVDGGVNFFDTAIGYQNGSSERYLGEALKKLSSRDKQIIATKFVPRSDTEISEGISGQKHIENLLDKSLRHLKTDYVDLYIYHMWDYRTDMYDIMDGLNEQVKKGKVRYIGISNCYAWQLAKINALAQREGFSQFVSVQNHYNLIFREEEREMAALCQHDNIAMTPYSALASGRLSRLSDEKTRRLIEDSYAHFKYDASAAEDQRIILRVNELSEKYQVSMTQIALAWLLTRVTSPVAGATSVSQVDDMLKAVDVNLSDEDIAYLEELYVPHRIVGVMAQNTASSDSKNQVWMKNVAKIK